MIIKIKKNYKDAIEKCSRKFVSRREFIEKGLVTSTLAVTLPKIMAGQLVKDAMGALPTCPPAVRNAQGSLTTLYAEGGMTVGAYFLSDIEAGIAASSANAARRYGISQTNITRLGTNLHISEPSIFGAELRRIGLELGFTAAQWDALLKRCNAGFHCGPFNQDDGNGQNRGYNVAISGAMRTSSINKSILFRTNAALAPFSVGVAASRLGGNATPAQLAALYSLTPAGQMNAASMQNAAETAHNLGQLFKGMLGLDKRTGSEELLTNATCGFVGDVPLTDPNYGNTLFNPAAIPALQPRVANAAISNEERSWLSASYNGNVGVTSGTNIELGGYDYHDQSPDTIGNATRRIARAFGIWLAAANAAQTRAAFSLVSNGQAIADGNTQATVGGTTGLVQNARGDAGGAHNKVVLITVDFRTGNTAAPAMRTLGAFDTTNGDSRSNLGDGLAMKGLVASALEFIGNGTITDNQLKLLGLSTTDYRSVRLLA